MSMFAHKCDTIYENSFIHYCASRVNDSSSSLLLFKTTCLLCTRKMWNSIYGLRISNIIDSFRQWNTYAAKSRVGKLCNLLKKRKKNITKFKRIGLLNINSFSSPITEYANSVSWNFRVNEKPLALKNAIANNKLSNISEYFTLIYSIGMALWKRLFSVCGSPADSLFLCSLKHGQVTMSFIFII